MTYLYVLLVVLLETFDLVSGDRDPAWTAKAELIVLIALILEFLVPIAPLLAIPPVLLLAMVWKRWWTR